MLAMAYVAISVMAKMNNGEMKIIMAKAKAKHGESSKQRMQKQHQWQAAKSVMQYSMKDNGNQ
jgi:hypothetical protein